MGCFQVRYDSRAVIYERVVKCRRPNGHSLRWCRTKSLRKTIETSKNEVKGAKNEITSFLSKKISFRVQNWGEREGNLLKGSSSGKSALSVLPSNYNGHAKHK